MMVVSMLFVAPAAGSPDDIHTHPSSIQDEELFASVDLSREGLEGVRASVEHADYAASGAAWAAYWRARQEPTMHFDRADWAGVIRRDYPQLAEALIAHADRVVAGDLSHATVALPVKDREIDWFHNPNKDTNYVCLVGTQWFLSPLGRAYLLTRDEKYADAFAWVFGSWFDHQEEIRRGQGGLGWDPIFRAYYPGIHVRILIDNYYCLAESPALTPEIHVELLKAILGASAWLYANNGRYKVGNQQVAAVMGMTVAGMVLPEFRQADAWAERGVQRMREHLERDFFPDGAHRELCTQYHKTCLRDMGYVALTAQRNGLPGFFDEGDESRGAFERAYEWLARVVMPQGLTPPIHSAVFSDDYAAHLQIAGEQFARPDFVHLAGRVWETAAVPSQKGPFSLANYLIGSPATETETSSPPTTNDHLPDSGFAIMRTGWGPADSYLILQYGWPNTGHAYPAALHFCLSINGEVIATSPGSPRSYALPSYRYCHSTPSHNVVSIDGRSYRGERGIAPGGTVHKLVDADGIWYIRASHEGYREALGAVHERQVLVLEDGPIVVRDVITGGEGHTAQWNFHTPLAVAEKEPSRLTLTGRQTYTLALADAEGLSGPTIEKHWSAVPPEMCQPDDCGKEVPAITFERRVKGGRAEFVAAIVVGDGHIARADENAYRVTWGETREEVRFAGDGQQWECKVGRYRRDREERDIVVE